MRESFEVEPAYIEDVTLGLAAAIITILNEVNPNERATDNAIERVGSMFLDMSRASDHERSQKFFYSLAHKLIQTEAATP